MQKSVPLIIAFLISLLSLLFNKVQAQTNQVVSNGQATTAANFPGSGCIYNWVNDNSSIGLQGSGTGDIDSFTAVNTNSGPVTATVTATPVVGVYAYMLITSGLYVVNTTTNHLVATVGVGSDPVGVTVNADGSMVYVTNLIDGTVSAVSTATNTVVSTIVVGSRPYGIVVSPDGKKVYVANSGSNNMSVIDATKNTVIATIGVGASPTGVTISPDGKFVYISNLNSGSVSVLNTANNAIVSTIAVQAAPYGISFSPDGSKVYVASVAANAVVVINASNNSIITTIPVGQFPLGTAVSTDGSRVYVTNQNSGDVSVINTLTNSVIATIPVGSNPSGISVSPDGSLVYVALNTPNNSIVVVSTVTNQVTATINIGSSALSFGDFIIGRTAGCPPVKFTYTVNPTLATPAITAGPVSGTITACAGSPSASPNNQQFTLSGSNLTNNLTATAPAGFEISLSPGSGYNTSFFITPTAGSVSNTIIYVRSSASANAGNISGNVVLTSSGAPSQNVAVTGVVNALPTVNAVANQSLDNGATTTAINFTGTANTFTWINDTPGIGLPASGSGNIAAFTAVNNDVTPVTATIRVTPSSTGASCSGAPATFTITVAPDPYSKTPAIIAGTTTGTITACAGSPSASPAIEQFTVSGGNLTGDITATAPAGFEVSLNSASGYGNSVTLVQNGETVNSTVVYVRSAASGPAGNISGNIVVSSTGAISQKVAVSGTVNALPTVNTIPNQTVANGAATTAVNFTGTASTFTWVNNTPAIGLAASGSGNISSFTATNSGSSPVIATITVTPVPSGGFAYIANEVSNSVSVIDLTTNNIVTTIPVGQSPYAVAVTPDKSTLYVTGLMYGTVSVINTATNTVTATITVGEYPSAIVVSPDGKYVYVADQSSNDVAKIDVTTNTVLSTFYSGGDPNSLWLSPDGSKLYALCYANNQLFVINTVNQTILKSLQVGEYPLLSAITPDASMLYVTNYASNDVSVISTQSNSVISIITVGQSPKGITISPDGTTAYVSNLGDNTISVINTATNTVVKTIDLGFKGGGLSLNNDGSLLYVTNFVANSVSVINTSTNAVVTTIPVGSGPESYGNFVVQGLGCTGKPTTFTITVNPSITPVINVGLLTGSIVACAGSPSVSPNIQQFTVSGSNLTGDIKMTSPSGFELSLTQGSGYNSSLTLPQSGGAVANTIVYVRSSSLAFPGAISGNVVLTSTGATSQNVAVTGVVNAIPVVNQPISLTYINGQSAGVNFAGTADTYSWVNDQPGIGLAASGTGNIGLFNAINTGNSPVVATITVTPSNSTGCDGSSKTFTITVNPTPSGISVGGRLSALNTVYGTPSSRESFTVSGTNLNAKVTITAPAGFEVSADGNAFAGSANINAPGTLANTTIYIRLAATTPVGNYSGNIVIASAGAASVNFAIPASSVRPASLVITADDKERFYETPNPDFTVQYNGFVNNENTSVLTKQPVVSTAATVVSLPGQYPITVSGASSPNYSISFVSGILTINPVLQSINIPNVFTPNGDGINDTWDITNLGGYVNCTVDVFSRYGQKVFSSVGYSAQWNGTRNNAAVPAGTYYYIINLNNGQKAYAGYVTIIR